LQTHFRRLPEYSNAKAQRREEKQLKRKDIHKILIIGSGPIVIGQACEFDYSGTQACKALRQEGYELVLVNSNPATIMTDPEIADRTYIEPLDVNVLTSILKAEKPDALLPTVGGQTGLNLTLELCEKNILQDHGVELLALSEDSLRLAEDRLLFKQAMEEIGLEVPRSSYVRSVDEALTAVKEIGYPAILRPSFTLGGSGGGIAFNMEEFIQLVMSGLEKSPVHGVLIEESLIGWKEYELEVMRDLKDNVVIICSIENFDPMGIHTGDSITVAPSQTLTDREYQKLRDASIAIIRKVGVQTGGSNIQFAVNPDDGRIVVIEMNPRVSRSSALASKATGFPIAKIAAKLAVGYTLDEIPNEITRKTMASFEPTLDYVVVKLPRWAFEKFKSADPILTTQMKSVGEVMSIGRTFKEALMKGIHALELKSHGLLLENISHDPAVIRSKLQTPTWDRIFYVAAAIEAGISFHDIHSMTNIDPWFLAQMEEILSMCRTLENWDDVSSEDLRKAKRLGLSDKDVAYFGHRTEAEVRQVREQSQLRPVYKRIDTCAAEFEAYTPYLYSTYERECEADPTNARKVVIVGSGCNRIGQGIEFDYCCCQASFALKEIGVESIMVNCNPETVSTDYDTSDRLYFEPITVESLLNIIHVEKPEGVIVQFGGQTSLKVAEGLHRAGVKILGTSFDSIDLAEDRKRFRQFLDHYGIRQPQSATCHSVEEAIRTAHEIGYPVMVRPSYVLGGRAMAIAYDDEDLLKFVEEAVRESSERAILIDHFLEDAMEYDLDALCQEDQIFVAGIIEHIERAGIHSGDSCGVLPSYYLSPKLKEQMIEWTQIISEKLKITGLMNIQFAVQKDLLYMLEVNPRASRTVPYVSKAIGIPLVKLATRLMTGERLKDFQLPEEIPLQGTYIKAPVFPFIKFPDEDVLLGPEMKSTGEVMGVGKDFGIAFAKALMAAGSRLPVDGQVFVSVNDRDKTALLPIATELNRLSFSIVATEGTCRYLNENSIPATKILKVNEGRPNIEDAIINGDIQLVINTPFGKFSLQDESAIRRTAIRHGVPCITTLAGAEAAIEGIKSLREGSLPVYALQEYNQEKQF
jgi:carbamoyl-phosphate synthase large subunit